MLCIISDGFFPNLGAIYAAGAAAGSPKWVYSKPDEV